MKKSAVLLMTAILQPLFIQATFIQATFIQTTWAQDHKAALVPLPSVDDFSRGNDGWGFGLGLGVEYESAYEGSDEFGFEPTPAGAVQWRRGDDVFYWAGEALGWRGLRSDTWLVEATVLFEEGRKESDSDDDRLDGLGNSDETVELVLQARRAFDADWRYWLDGRIVAGEDGGLGIFGIGRRFGDRKDGTGSDLAIAVVFHDSERANRDFGIDAGQSAASGLNETRVSGGLRSVGINYTYRNYLSEHLQIFGEVLYEHYSSEVTDSPIARGDFEAEVGIGVIYVF